jgi:hypothetical protein
MSANGADDGIAGDFCGLSFFDDELEGGADVGTAAEIEAGCVGVTVNWTRVFKLEFLGDGKRCDPVEKSPVNFFAIRVVADGAFAGVAGGVPSG